MPQRIKCPTGHSLIVADDRAGRTLRCPRCGESVLVPGEAGVVSLASDSSAAPPVSERRESPEESPIVAVTVPSTAIAPSRPILKPQQPPCQSRPAAAPIKPKSRVLPVVTSAPGPPPISLPATVSEPPAAIPPVVSPPVIELPAPDPPPLPPVEPSPPAKEEPVAEDSRLDGSLALPDSPAPSESATESSGDIAAFLHLQFADQPAFAAPPRSPVAARRSLDDDASRTLGVYQLAAALVAAALFSVAPAVWDLVEYIRIDDLDAPFVARWALVLFFLGIVQLAYAVYLFQLPDWATVWVVTVLLLLMAAGYAAVLGMVLISDGDGLLVGPHGLQLADKLAGGQAALWCLCMVCVATILAFFAGRMSVRWRAAERVLQAVGY
jgi:hypothetical protein